MTETLVDRAPRVRCYECGSDVIFSVCHHCQRPMCAEHSPLAYRQGGVLVRTPTGAADEARAASKELAGLRLGGLREAVYHCRDHAHLVRGGLMRWVAAGAGVAALGFLLLFAAASVGLVLMLIGAIVAGIALLLHQATITSAARPPLPLVPQVNTIEVLERVTGYVRLEKDEYTSTVGSVAGRMTIDMSANDGHAVLRAYRRKFRLPVSEPVRFAGGFLMVEGNVGLAFRAGQPSVLTGGTGISLGGESTADHDLFPDEPELTHRESTLAIDYEVQDDRSPREIPLWIVPSLVPASDRRTFEIDLHWNRLGARGQRIDLALFDLIELEVPASWGNVEGVAPGRVEIGRSGDRRVIRWKQLKPETPGASLTLTLRFERPITEVPESTGPTADDPAPSEDDGDRTRLSLAGTLEATFNGLLSGVTGVGVYLPGGGSGHRPPLTRQTKVALTFDVSLRSLRYQDERVVPDENNRDDVAYARNRPDELHGVVPDYRTVAELTNAISADSYYVKRVVEHPPFRDEWRPGVVNRVWDIAGRRYIGVFPIDFDINLRGEEIGTAGASSGKTVVQVTVKGAHVLGTLVDKRESTDRSDAGADLALAVEEADGPDEELLKLIEDTWTSLHARVTQILADRAGRTGGIRAVTSSPEGVVVGEVIESNPDGRTEGVVTVETVPAPDSTEVTAADLRRQRMAADEALIAGRMSEDTHRGIIARIEAELREMGEPS